MDPINLELFLNVLLKATIFHTTRLSPLSTIFFFVLLAWSFLDDTTQLFYWDGFERLMTASHAYGAGELLRNSTEFDFATDESKVGYGHYHENKNIFNSRIRGHGIAHPNQNYAFILGNGLVFSSPFYVFWPMVFGPLGYRSLVAHDGLTAAQLPFRKNPKRVQF